MKRIGIIFIGIVIIAILGIIISFSKEKTDTKAKSDIPYYTIEKGEFVTKLTEIGEAKAAKSSVLTAPYDGKVTKLIPEGSNVKEGDPVIWMETTTYEENLEEAKVNLQLSESSLKQKVEGMRIQKIKDELSLKEQKASVAFQELKLKDAKEKYENQKILVEKSLAAQSSLETAKIEMLQAELSLKNAQISLTKLMENQASQYKILQAEIEKAKIDLDKNTKSVKDTQDKLDNAIIKATGPGMVTYSTIWKSGTMGKVQEGDSVWPRSSLAEIPDPTVMWVIFRVNEIDVSKVQEGQEVDIKFDSIPDKTYIGKVIKKGAVAAQSKLGFSSQDQNIKEFEITAEIEDKDDRIRQGMTANTDVIIYKVENAIYVPNEAVIKTEVDKEKTKNEAENFVYVLKDNGQYAKLKVQIGLTNANFIEIKEGLKEGEKVLLRDPTKKLETVGTLEEEKKSKGLFNW